MIPMALLLGPTSFIANDAMIPVALLLLPFFLLLQTTARYLGTQAIFPRIGARPIQYSIYLLVLSFFAFSPPPQLLIAVTVLLW